MPFFTLRAEQNYRHLKTTMKKILWPIWCENNNL